LSEQLANRKQTIKQGQIQTMWKLWFHKVREIL